MVTPSEEQKDRMFRNAVELSEKNEKREEKKNMSKIIRTICSVAVAAAVIGTTTVFADEIKSTFYNIFSNDNVISDGIIENVYSESDGHIEFSVEKIVSDTINTFAIVRYTALDEKGKEWLGTPFENTEDYCEEGGMPYELIGKQVYIQPGKDEVNYSWGGMSEMTDSTEENSRVFKIECNASDAVTDTEYVNLYFEMPDSRKHKKIKITESVPLINIALDSSKAAENYYIPTGVKLSSLGIMVYGMNNGLYEEYIDENGNYVLTSLNDEKVSVEVEIVTKDGSEVPVLHPWSLGAETDKRKDYDVAILTDYFEEPVDTDNIAGIIIDGVYFELNLS